VEELAATLLSAYDMGSTPPIDVELLARHLGVEAISRKRMLEDGRLEQQEGRALIFVRSGVGRERARFTVAHEIAHLVLAGPERDFIARRALAGDWHEERFCDQFAAALLMPGPWVRSNFASRPKEFSTLKALAGASQTSLSAALMRLREVSSWRSCLLRWNLEGDQWRLASSVGTPIRMRNRLTTTPATAAVLDQMSPDDRRFVSHLPIGVNGISRCFGAEVQMWRRSAAALTDLSSVPASVAETQPPSSRSSSHSERNWADLRSLGPPE